LPTFWSGLSEVASGTGNARWASAGAVNATMLPAEANVRRVRLTREVVLIARGDLGLIEQRLRGGPCGRSQGQTLAELNEATTVARQHVDELACFGIPQRLASQADHDTPPSGMAFLRPAPNMPCPRDLRCFDIPGLF
jgi:hypothetical protein